MSQPLHLVMIVLNAIGVIIYDLSAAAGWRNPAEHGMIPVTGEPFVWFLGIIGVVTVFFVLNLIWGTLILVHRQWRSMRIWLLAASMWLVAVAIDFAHH
ncbi:MAG: hypothetical protein ABI197_05780 [Granulicella sp.]